MAPVDFYMILPSAPCRATLLTINALGLNVNRKFVNLVEKEQLKPEFTKLNPQHTVPTIVDGDFVLWESRAIMGYLVGQYGKDDSLYPKDPKKRAIVDHRLYFDMGTLFLRFRHCYRPVIFDEEKFDPAKENHVVEAIDWLNTMIGEKKWSCGDNITIADHALAASMATIKEVAIKVDFAKFPNVVRWMKQCKAEMPGYAENEEGAQFFGNMFKRAYQKVMGKE